MKSKISEDKFITVYKAYNGCYTHIARKLHINHRTVKRRSLELGLKPYEYLTISKAAEILNVPRPTLYTWTRQEKFPGVKFNGRTFIDKSAIRLFIRPENRPQTTMEPGYITVTQAAKKLNYCVARIRRMCQHGNLPAKKNSHGVWMIWNS